MRSEDYPAERYFEDWIVENPGEVAGEGATVLGRQIVTGEGRLDVLLMGPGDDPVELFVVEVKRDRIDVGAVSQVCRYMNDLDPIYVEMVMQEPRAPATSFRGIVAAPHISDDAAEIVAAATNLHFLRLTPRLDFAASRDGIFSTASWTRPDICSTGGVDELLAKIRGQVTTRTDG